MQLFAGKPFYQSDINKQGEKKRTRKLKYSQTLSLIWTSAPAEISIFTCSRFVFSVAQVRGAHPPSSCPKEEDPWSSIIKHSSLHTASVLLSKTPHNILQNSKHNLRINKYGMYIKMYILYNKLMQIVTLQLTSMDGTETRYWSTPVCPLLAAKWRHVEPLISCEEGINH